MAKSSNSSPISSSAKARAKKDSSGSSPAKSKANGNSANFTQLLGEVRERCDARLRDVFEKQAPNTELSRRASLLWTTLDEFTMRGGKRLRAALIAVGYLSHENRLDWRAVLPAMSAVELLQSYFLVHDDWMDNDVLRRGGPTVHVSLGKKLKSQSRGDHAAILTGDWGQGLALAELSECKVTAERFSKMVPCFAQMQNEAVLGQILDVLQDAPDAETIYSLKTASYTIMGPLRLGAIAAGASAKTLKALDNYSQAAGIAFQLRDDILGAMGSPAQTGKGVGGHLQSGKDTPLLAYALRQATPKQRKLLKSVIGNENLDLELLAQAQQILIDCGAVAHVEKRIEELTQLALKALKSRAISPLAQELLLQATSALIKRSH